ncbi:CapA family protein [Fulvivirga sedimenti]|uniref:CapA family protein n=1 Tax=Fulvivirga sedimenti TaxID=2879465 RepID=A0A9X1L2C1_9BACT|nr:CapA family protein [Fulvivirga sedimenti]MCA6079142.1 CapA family protein [Fulvivirga sedimenti]
MSKYLRNLIILLILTVTGCKTAQQTTKTPDIQPTKVDSTFTRIDTLGVKADTLIILKQDSVEIGIHRIFKDTVRIIGVGDIMMGTNFPDESYLPSNRGKDLLREVTPILQDADITFGNLEGVILNEGGDEKKCKDPKLCYIFRSPEYLAQNLVDAGFDVMSTANNHAGDFGDPGRKNTQRVLDSLGLYHAGQVNTPYVTFMRDGMRYGFAAFSPNSNTMSINDHEAAAAIVQHLDSISDIVIVSFHGGAEGSKYQTVPRQEEMFYGENRGDVYAFSHAMIDAGADVIFGHGPHVTRAIDIYKNRFIAYSLGNFCTYARFNLRDENGLAPIVKVYTGPDGAFLFGEIIPTIQTGAGGPSIDEKGRVINTIRSLTEKDFPEVQVSIDDSGRINYLHGE